ncbi:hypothetical protein EON65_31605 [archaeon]|nr:MAG: hypothetical protein EON65_31605 [archaeon]
MEFAVRVYFLLATIAGIVLLSSPDKLHHVAVPYTKVYDNASALSDTRAEAVCSASTVICPSHTTSNPEPHANTHTHTSKFTGNVSSLFMLEHDAHVVDIALVCMYLTMDDMCFYGFVKCPNSIGVCVCVCTLYKYVCLYICHVSCAMCYVLNVSSLCYIYINRYTLIC